MMYKITTLIVPYVLKRKEYYSVKTVTLELIQSHC